MATYIYHSQKRAQHSSRQTGGSGKTGAGPGSTSSNHGKDLMHVSVYYNSFNTKYVVNNKVYEVTEDKVVS